MVLLLFVLSIPRIPCHVHFTNIAEFCCSSLPVCRRRLIFPILLPNVQKQLSCCYMPFIKRSSTELRPSQTCEHVIKTICPAGWLHHVFFFIALFCSHSNMTEKCQPFSVFFSRPEGESNCCSPTLTIQKADLDSPVFPSPLLSLQPHPLISSLCLFPPSSCPSGAQWGFQTFCTLFSPPPFSLNITNILCSSLIYSDLTSLKIKQQTLKWRRGVSKATTEALNNPDSCGWGI